MLSKNLQKRLEELRNEYQVGQAQVKQLEARQAELNQTLLRIAGAIQVLEEVLQSEPENAGAAS